MKDAPPTRSLEEFSINPAELFTKDGGQISISITADVGVLGVLRSATKILLSYLELSETKSKNIIFAIDELVTNAITYGSSRGDMCTLILGLDANVLTIEVHDTGRSLDSRSAGSMEKLLSANQQQWKDDRYGSRGRGISIVSEMFDTLVFRDLEKGGLAVSLKTQAR